VRRVVLEGAVRAGARARCADGAGAPRSVLAQRAARRRPAPEGTARDALSANLTLVAYYLALDAQPEFGNNALLAERLGGTREGPFAEIGAAARLDEPVGIDELSHRLREATGREPLVFAEGPARIERIAVVTGGGGTRLIEAAHEGFDALVTGEPEEPALHTARELGIHFLAGGHYATETFGVNALGARLAEEFALEWEFVDVPNRFSRHDVGDDDYA
jgi:putative NIF3 family GTP cyclohydrolase 1 type 2